MNRAQEATEQFMRGLKQCNPHQPAFHQVVLDTMSSIMPHCLEHEHYERAAILERLTEPDRIIRFRVTWQDDKGRARVNRAWRVQHNNCLGPYKGGLRFHRDVNEDTFRFLAFEQTLKNSLTGQPMGGAKGGADFDPSASSEDEILRFCQSLMVELYRYIGDDVDVPAGDIGVGSTEIGYLFGHYMRLSNAWSGVLTGKGCAFGGSAGRTEATGYGCVHFCQHALDHAGDELTGKRVAISGAGTVALYAAEKAFVEGAKVMSVSDSKGMLHFPRGLNRDELQTLIALKAGRRSLREFPLDGSGAEYHAGATPWSIPCEVALPCATENELDADAAETLIGNGVRIVCEGANMPCTPGAIERFEARGVIFAPGKAANAGGVAVSGMELSQNAMRLSWTRERIDEELRETMSAIHALCVENGESGGKVDYIKGANLAAFRKLADAMLAYGVA